jgi:hypothetical protein
MPHFTFRRPAALFAITGLLALPAHKSDQVGIYAVIDKVVLAPDATNPTTIQIWGTFSTSEGIVGDNYRAAVKGYVYYRMNPAGERATRAEWADLQSIAGKKAIVGFGRKYAQTGPIARVRCATEAPSSPDEYPVNVGVFKMAQPRNTGWPIAEALLKPTPTDAPCAKAK